MSRVIKEFQKKHGLVDDGIVGKNTLLKFKEVFKIPTKIALIHFAANMAHESGNFKIIEESGSYSAKRLLQIFPKYFKTLEEAKASEYNAEKIFNKTYGGRMGNVAPNDGYKYRGRGFMQITGKHNYIKFGEYLGVDLVNNPDLVATKYPIESAVFYFDSNKLWNLVKDTSLDSIRRVRKRVNGGYNGIDDVINKTRYYERILK